MSITAVKEYLKQFNLDSRVQEFEQSSATVELAAQAADVIPARIAKTLSFKVGEGAGHAVGGVCPFAVTNGNVRIYLDESIKRFDSVLPAAGSSNSCLRLDPEELMRASKAEGWIDVCKLQIEN